MDYEIIKEHKNEIGKYSIPSRDVVVLDFDNDYAHENEGMMKMHTHDFYIVSFIEQGSLSHHIDMDRYVLTDNTLLMIAPGERHYTELLETGDVKGVSINFPEDYFQLLPIEWGDYIKFRVFRCLHQLRLTSSGSIDKIKEHVALLKEQCKINESATNEIGVYAALTSLLNAVCHTTEFKDLFPDLATGVTETEKTYMIFRAVLEREFSKHHTMRYYCEQLGISANKLNACCMAVDGMKASDAINARLLLEAKKMLRYTDLQGKEIAASLGFTDRGNFLNWFKKHTGLTASAFRQRVK